MSYYKPLIATSLALALSVSVASAGDCDSISTSAVCWNQSASEAGFQQFSGLTFAPTGQGDNQFNQLKYTALQGITISDFTLKFKNAGGGNTVTGPEASVAGNNAQLKLINKGNGLQLGSAGNSTLTVDFGMYNKDEYNQAPNRSRKATLTFEGTTPANANSGTPKTALKGNIKVLASAFTNDSMDATFNGDMIGNIDIIYQNNILANPLHRLFFVKTNWNFKNGASLKGNLKANLAHGGQNFTFEGGGNIEGNIQTFGYVDYGSWAASASGAKTDINITFKNHTSTNIIKGSGSTRQILAKARGSNSNAYNRILFEGNGQIGEQNNRISIIADTKGQDNGESYNFIQFKKQATLFLENLQVGNHFVGNRLNVISLENEIANDDLKINEILVRGNNNSGRNYIGKGLLKLNGSSEAKDLVLKIDENKLNGTNYKTISENTKEHIASGSLTTNRIATTNEGGGTNGVFIGTITVEDIIDAWGSSRNIITGSTFTTKRIKSGGSGVNVITADTKMTIDNGVFSSGGGNHIFISGSGSIGQNGIAENGNATGNFSLYTTTGGSNVFYLEGSGTTLSLQKGVRHNWDAWQTVFNFNGENNKIEIKGNNTEGSNQNVGIGVGGSNQTNKPGMTFNFNGNNGELDVKNNNGTSGGGNIIVGRDGGDKNAKLTLNFKGDNTTIKGNIFTQSGGDQNNTTTFNIANGKSVEVQGLIKNQKAGGANANANNAQTIFNFGKANDSQASRTSETPTALKITGNLENTSGEVLVNFNTGSTLTLEGTTNAITTLNNASTASTLALGKVDGTGTTTTTIGGITNGENLTIQFLGETSTLNLGGTNNTIKTLDLQATTNALNITAGKTTITDPVNRDGSKTFNVAFSGDNSTLTLKGNKNHITTLKLDGSATKATIDIASDKYPNPNTPAGNTRNFNLLEIGTNNGEGLTASNLTFKVFVDPLATQGSSTIGGETTGASGTYGVAHSDRIVIHSATTAGTPLKENLVVIVDPEKYNGIEYGADTGTEETQRVRNIAVATVKNGSDDKPLVKFEAKHSDIGGEAVTIELREAKTNQYGKLQGEKGYTTYFLGKIISLGVTRSTQKAVASALAINYDLYVANFNSLNKRMGELRDNTNSQGIWARVFGGLQESTFGAKLHTQYISTQAGYDYALNLEGARNYLGLAFSYINSTGTSGDEDPIDELYPTSLSNVQSNGAEVALYNSYVSDMGIYNDTIAKFSYITSDFKLSNSVKDSQTNNLGFTLSNEVGYRFILGEKQDYFIDPQLEIGLGYLNQSNFIANLKALTGRINELKANQNYILLARTRAGASFGKKIVEQGKNISLYAGAFYEYDFIDGGSNKITTTRIQHTNPALESNGRVVLNLGTNLELNQSTRVYMDIEKSFGDKLRTHLQFNLGGRYSF
ncbi:hypothetical protein BBW65_00335 [Helicobacter enhydrae]|uniref:Autotransporter domain-containing protein n=1 Tax=Helicobacter enhydrae TaxID=222136 RepID=A0A1B1U3M8_9HELI|nr:autotransporter outer membrane beta-barrel domain-containing protein [Helicobacter enhydrae]ANV97361.1 hypothetical protein BBW65_00335 [Helicobacter enhydrae]